MIYKEIFKAIRVAHVAFSQKEFPKDIGLYFHSVEDHEIQSVIEALDYFKDLGYVTTDPLNFGNRIGLNLYVSFDDNYYNWLKISDILSKRGEVATFFTNTGPLSDQSSKAQIDSYFDKIKHFDSRKTLASKDVYTMFHDYKQIIGGHTCNHPNLTEINFNQAKLEILDNKNELEDIIGSEIIHFSYPFGMRRFFNDSLRTYCREIGYQTVSNAIPGLLYSKYDKYDINRTMWSVRNNLSYNLQNIKVKGSLFEKITGKSPIG